MVVTRSSNKTRALGVASSTENFDATRTAGHITGGDTQSLPSQEGGSLRDMECPQCKRAFETKRGLGQHVRAAHPQVRNDSLKEAPRSRRINWSEEERLLVAREEAQLEEDGVPKNANGSSGMLSALCKTFTRRSRNSIRGLRRTVEYQTVLVQCRDRIKAAITERSSESTDEDSADGAEPVGELNLPKGNGLTEAGNCETAAHINKKFGVWVRKHEARTRHKRVPTTGPVVSGNRAARRRIRRAAWLTGFERRPKTTSRRICEGKGLNDRESFPDGMYEYWGDMFGGEARPVGQLKRRKWGNEYENLLRPITRDELKTHLSKMKNGAAGVDGISLAKLKDINAKELVEWFNCFLRVGAIPKRLKRFRTIFLRKVEGAAGPKDFRPITIGSYIRRLFDGILAKRLRQVQTHFSQRGFKAMDGCSINQEMLRAVVSEHISSRRGLSYVFLDVAKAFDSVSHERVEMALRQVGIPRGLGKLLMDTLRGNTTVFGADERIVRIRRGVLQGDPLSPMIFNFVMDTAIRSLDDRIGGSLGGTKVPQLLFADDAVLFGETLDGLQRNVDVFSRSLLTFGLSMNATKCAAVHIRVDGKAKRWYVDDSLVLKVGGSAVRSMGVGEAYKYLGLRMCLGNCDTDVHKELENMLGNISASVVKPQHKLKILQTTAIPKVEYILVNGRYSLGALKGLDRMCRGAVRSWLHLPKDTPDAMYYTAKSDGGLGVPCFYTKIPRLQKAKRERIKNMVDPDVHLLALLNSSYWLNGSPKAPRALGTEIDKNGEELPSYLESRLTEREYWRQRLYSTTDGMGLKSHSGGFNSRFFDESFIRLSGKEFVKAIHLRCGALRTPARSNRGRVFGKGPRCPTCPDRVASLTHLIQNCPRTKSVRTKRHDIVAGMISSKLRKLGYEVREEPRIPSGTSYLKPDIVAFRRRDMKVAVIDPTIVTCVGDLEELAVAKRNRYVKPEVFSWLVHEYGPCGERDSVMVEGIAINFRGAISKLGSDALQTLGVKPSFLELLSFRVLKLGGFIYSSLRHRSDWNCGSARDGASKS